MNKSRFNYSMTKLYNMVGISKQAHYKRVQQQEKFFYFTHDILAKDSEIRKDHRRMGCRKLYNEIKPEAIGRDKFESILLSNGFRVKRKRNYHRTTYAGKTWYPNRISGTQVSWINQVWVSDITYIPIAYKKHYYLTLVQDVYSRKITGWQLSKEMSAEQTVVPAYQMGIGSLSKEQRKGLIFHSDKGSQYSWKELEQEHINNEVQPSMGGKAWENAHAESINGVLKNEYINFENMNVSLKQARGIMERIIDLYNNKRPHGSLNKMKPTEFETYVQTHSEMKKPVFKINY